MMGKPLIDDYHSFMAETWDGDEESIPMGMLELPDGSITMVALALDPPAAYECMLEMVVVQQANEAVFSLDRFTKPDQGTKYGDVLAGHYFNRALPKPWKQFIIEYQKEPRLFEPVDYDNEFWNRALAAELNATMRNMIRRIAESAFR